MNDHTTPRIREIRDRVASREYEVDPRDVAEALLERLLSARSRATAPPPEER
jgi:anti-sigma28 factor (negative regulator of flagellin synthesis)